MKEKKLIAYLLSMVLAVMLLTACNGKQSSSNPEGDSQQSAEKTKVVYWHTYTDQHEQALLKIINGFNSSQDKYEVVAEQQPYSEIDSKLLQAVRNGIGPDVVNMFPSDAVNYKNDGLLVDLAPFINDAKIGIPNFKSNIPEGIYKEITQWGGDSIYLFPCTTVGEVLFYNKTMFDKYGLKAPETWSDVEEYSKIIYTKEGIPGFGTDSVTDTYQCLIMQAGSGYIDAQNMKMDIDENIAKKQLNWFTDGVKDGYFRLVGEDMFFSNPFGSKAIASYIGSSAGASYVFSAVGDAFEVGCVPIPQEGPKKYISQWGNNLICLSKDDSHARGAYEFIKYFTSKDVVVEWAIAFGSIPVFTDAVESEKYQEYAKSSIVTTALMEEIQHVGMLPSVMGSKNVRTEIDKMIKNVALGSMDTETAYKAFITAAQDCLGK